MKKLLQKFWRDEQGLELSEYAVMAALVIIIAVVVITTLGQNIQAVFQGLSDKIGGLPTQ